MVWCGLLYFSQQIQEIVSLLLKKETENDIDFLRKIMGEISDRATARGLTSTSRRPLTASYKFWSNSTKVSP